MELVVVKVGEVEEDVVTGTAQELKVLAEVNLKSCDRVVEKLLLSFNVDERRSCII